MDGARQHGFAGAGLTEDQERQIGSRRDAGELQAPQHASVATLEIIECAMRCVEGSFEISDAHHFFSGPSASASLIWRSGSNAYPISDLRPTTISAFPPIPARSRSCVPKLAIEESKISARLRKVCASFALIPAGLTQRTRPKCTP